jgi:hypothetical protein
MIHIQSYKLFENQQMFKDMEDYIKDIFIDLTDNGYHVDIFPPEPARDGQTISGYPGVYSSITTIFITKLYNKYGQESSTICRDEFNTNDIRKYVEWLGKYMKDEGFTEYWVWVDREKNIPIIPRRTDKNYNLVHYDNESVWNEKTGIWVSHGFLKTLYLKVRDRLVNEKILPKNIVTEQVILKFGKKYGHH